MSSTNGPKILLGISMHQGVAASAGKSRLRCTDGITSWLACVGNALQCGKYLPAQRVILCSKSMKIHPFNLDFSVSASPDYFSLQFDVAPVSLPYQGSFPACVQMIWPSSPCIWYLCAVPLIRATFLRYPL